MQPAAARPRRVAGYISHRLAMAGGADDRVHFSPNAIDAVFRVSGGTPRVINLICDRALHRGHLARKSAIDLEAVTQAIDDLGVGTLTAAPHVRSRVEIPSGTQRAHPSAELLQWLQSPSRALPRRAPWHSPTHELRPLPARCRQTQLAVSTDLSGLEVHSIEESPAAPHDVQRMRRRTMARSSATPAAETLALAGHALGGRGRCHGRRSSFSRCSGRPCSSTTSRHSKKRIFGCLTRRHRRACPRRTRPVPIPADVTQPPPMPDELAVEPDTAPPTRR